MLLSSASGEWAVLFLMGLVINTHTYIFRAPEFDSLVASVNDFPDLIPGHGGRLTY